MPEVAERERHLLATERALAKDRRALAAALEALVARHVPQGGTLTPFRYRRIMDGLRDVQAARYGARRGSLRGSLYRLVAEGSRAAWTAPVVMQGRRSRRILKRAAPDALAAIDGRAAGGR